MIDPLRATELMHALETLKLDRGRDTENWLAEVGDVLRLSLPESSRLLVSFDSIAASAHEKAAADKPETVAAVNRIIDSAQKYLRLSADQSGGGRIDQLVRNLFHEQFIGSWPLKVMLMITLLAVVITFGGSFLTYVDIRDARQEIAQNVNLFDDRLRRLEDSFQAELDKTLEGAIIKADTAADRIEDLLTALSDRADGRDEAFAQEIEVARSNLLSLQTDVQRMEAWAENLSFRLSEVEKNVDAADARLNRSSTEPPSGFLARVNQSLTETATLAHVLLLSIVVLLLFLVVCVPMLRRSFMKPKG